MGDDGDTYSSMHTSINSTVTAWPACYSLWEVLKSFIMSINTGLQQPTLLSDNERNTWGIFLISLYKVWEGGLSRYLEDRRVDSGH